MDLNNQQPINSISGGRVVGTILRILSYCVMACCMLCCCGCNDQQFSHAPVSGIVQINGKPMKGIRVLFQPRSKTEDGAAGQISYAVSDSAGHYELKMVDGRQGAIVGDHRIVFGMYKADKHGDLLLREALPSRFNSASKFSFEVPPAGTTNADFQLEAKEVKEEQLWQHIKGNTAVASKSSFDE